VCPSWAIRADPSYLWSHGSLFDNLIGGSKQRWGHGKAQRLCGFEVDNEIELVGALHRKISGLGAFKEAVNESGGRSS
jgi:hypothetical protein